MRSAFKAEYAQARGAQPRGGKAAVMAIFLGQGAAMIRPGGAGAQTST
jgi:hypothetical protein